MTQNGWKQHHKEPPFGEFHQSSQLPDFHPFCSASWDLRASVFKLTCIISAMETTSLHNDGATSLIRTPQPVTMLYSVGTSGELRVD